LLRTPHCHHFLQLPFKSSLENFSNTQTTNRLPASVLSLLFYNLKSNPYCFNLVATFSAFAKNRQHFEQFPQFHQQELALKLAEANASMFCNANFLATVSPT
jgi:hypothetical protein